MQGEFSFATPSIIIPKVIIFSAIAPTSAVNANSLFGFLSLFDWKVCVSKCHHNSYIIIIIITTIIHFVVVCF